MSINLKIIIIVWFFIFSITTYYTYVLNNLQKSEYIEGIDNKLYTAALMAKATLPDDYHDRLVDNNSITPEDYLKQIDRYNRLCVELGLQYLWSNLVIDDKIVFTSSTSTSKKVENGDHALFFDVHSNPEAFSGVLTTGKTHYSTFKNEWGTGRMVLIPFLDNKGRRFVFGASISINEFDERIARLEKRSLITFIVMLIVSVGISLPFTRTITNPILRVTNIARDIANGEYGKQIESLSRSKEISSLKESINQMSTAIQEHNDNLESLVEQRAKEIKLKDKELLESHAREYHASKMASLGEMASNIGHEINSPLQAISFIAYRVKKIPERVDEIKQAMDKQINLVMRVSTIIESLKKLVRDSFSDPFEDAQVTEIINDIINISTERFRRYNIDFRLVYHDNAESSVINCQQILISQILLNLLNNAFDAISENAEKWVALDVYDLGESIKMTVTDSGQGIDKSIQDRIFEPLFTTKEIGKGTGIGLSISLEIANKHGGTLEYDSRHNNTRFVLCLPKFKQPKGED